MSSECSPSLMASKKLNILLMGKINLSNTLKRGDKTWTTTALMVEEFPSRARRDE